WRRQSFYFTFIFLFGYILMMGAPPSAARAGLMAGFLLFAQHTGRLKESGRIIVFAAAIMLAINPLLLKTDVGFQLSFMACLSIIYIKPILDKFLEKLPNLFATKDIINLTLAAQIGVLPLLIFHFGRVSFISPLANLLIVPILPFLMIGGLITSFTGFISVTLARLISFPLWLLLNYIFKTIDYLSIIPLASMEIKNFHLVFLILYYLLLIIYVSRKKI
ncbi:MAG: ComEC/Rec2 family competence protein, partial [bacterium]